MNATARFAVISALLWVALSAALYPGLMAPDSLFQYVQAKSGLISNWHPPVMVYLWQLTDRLIAGPGGMYLLAMTLYGIAAITLCVQWMQSNRSRLLLFSLLTFPAPLAVLMTVWKDALLIAALMSALSMLIWTQRHYHPLKLLAGLALLTLAALLRHNAILALLPLIWLFLAARSHCSHEPAKRSTHLTATTCSGKLSGINWCRTTYVLIVAGLMIQTGKLIDTTTQQASPIPMVATWDLAAISLLEDEMLLPEYALHDSQLSLQELETLFAPISNVPLCRLQDGVRQVYCVEALPLRRGDGIAKDKVDDLLAHWIAVIATHPLAYLQHRFTVLCHLLDLCAQEGVIHFNAASMQPDALQGDWYDGPEADALGIQSFALPSAAGQRLIDLLSWLNLHTVLLSPWVYALLLLYASLTLFCHSRVGGNPVETLALETRLRGYDNVLKGAVISAWLMALPLFIIAPNYQLRYLIWPMLVAIVSLTCHKTLTKH